MPDFFYCPALDGNCPRVLNYGECANCPIRRPDAEEKKKVIIIGDGLDKESMDRFHKIFADARPEQRVSGEVVDRSLSRGIDFEELMSLDDLED